MVYLFKNDKGNELSCAAGRAMATGDGGSKLAEDVVVGDYLFVRTWGINMLVDTIETVE